MVNMNKKSKENQALEHELNICIDIEDGQLEDIFIAFEEFKKERTLPGAYTLSKMVRSWVDTRQRYDLLHRIKMAGWDDDTKHE
jgi:hypothetical protein